MKRTKILYWVFTILFAGFMLFTALPDLLKSKDAMNFIEGLGYPDYFVPFLGFAKILGSIAILIPGFPRIKEWAYAGLAFDLIGAVYSVLAVAGWNSGILFMILPISLLVLSYIWHHKLLLASKAMN